MKVSGHRCWFCFKQFTELYCGVESQNVNIEIQNSGKMFFDWSTEWFRHWSDAWPSPSASVGESHDSATDDDVSWLPFFFIGLGIAALVAIVIVSPVIKGCCQKRRNLHKFQLWISVEAFLSSATTITIRVMFVLTGTMTFNLAHRQVSRWFWIVTWCATNNVSKKLFHKFILGKKLKFWNRGSKWKVTGGTCEGAQDKEDSFSTTEGPQWVAGRGFLLVAVGVVPLSSSWEKASVP